MVKLNAKFVAFSDLFLALVSNKFFGVMVIFFVFYAFSGLLYAANTSKTNNTQNDVISVPAGTNTVGFQLKQQSQTPILEYTQSVALLASFSTRPSVKIYSDGRVKVHRPVYLKQAGDYEFTLPSSELIDLLRSLSSDGLMTFDSKKVKNSKRLKQQQENKDGELYVVTDVMETVVDIHLDNYQASSNAKVTKQFATHFSWQNLEADTRHYKGLQSLQSASKAISRLELLKHHHLMKKVK